MSELTPAQRTWNHRRVIGRIVGLFAFVAALILLPVSAGDWKRGYDSATWPRASGSITSSEVRTDRVRRRTVYRPHIAYRFRVDGHEFTGNRPFFGSTSFAKEQDARSYADKYPVGKSVEVRYEPGLPESCVLEPGAPRDGALLLSLGVGCLVLACAANWFGFRRRLARPGDPE